MNIDYYDSVKSITDSLGLQHISSARKEALNEILLGLNGQRVIFPTGFKRLDNQLLGGLLPGKLYVIGSRPGGGKSMLSTEIMFRAIYNAQNHSNKKIICLYFTFEMFGSEHITRLISKDMNKTVHELYSVEKILSKEDYLKSIKSSERFVNLPIYFKSISTSIDEAIELIERFQKLFPDYTILNILDHSRLFNNKNEANEMAKLSKLSQGLIKLQKKIKCINILLTQLNREADSFERKAKGNIPQGSDIFGGDSIMQEAHVVMLINRPEAMYNYTKDYCGLDPRNLLALHIVKNRQGPIGIIPFDVDATTFNISERKQDRA